LRARERALVRELEGKSHLEHLSVYLSYNIKLDIKGIERENMDWITEA
jgi:hypothetical protein